mmetsp:Transcript_5765/g.14378  ORF Transcript_5765/g.14378 Transcript_5765/m.14378 type:complete len:586 (-) Transcript_5765:554-2311(-)
MQLVDMPPAAKAVRPQSAGGGSGKHKKASSTSEVFRLLDANRQKVKNMDPRGLLQSGKAVATAAKRRKGKAQLSSTTVGSSAGGGNDLRQVLKPSASVGASFSAGKLGPGGPSFSGGGAAVKFNARAAPAPGPDADGSRLSQFVAKPRVRVEGSAAENRTASLSSSSSATITTLSSTPPKMCDIKAGPEDEEHRKKHDNSSPAHVPVAVPPVVPPRAPDDFLLLPTTSTSKCVGGENANSEGKNRPHDCDKSAKELRRSGPPRQSSIATSNSSSSSSAMCASASTTAAQQKVNLLKEELLAVKRAIRREPERDAAKSQKQNGLSDLVQMGEQVAAENWQRNFWMGEQQQPRPLRSRGLETRGGQPADRLPACLTSAATRHKSPRDLLHEGLRDLELLLSNMRDGTSTSSEGKVSQGDVAPHHSTRSFSGTSSKTAVCWKTPRNDTAELAANNPVQQQQEEKNNSVLRRTYSEISTPPLPDNCNYDERLVTKVGTSREAEDRDSMSLKSISVSSAISTPPLGIEEIEEEEEEENSEFPPAEMTKKRASGSAFRTIHKLRSARPKPVKMRQEVLRNRSAADFRFDAA